MTGIAQLKARVEGALERISQQAEAREAFDQKLLDLIDVMERGLNRKQGQIDESQARLAALQAEQAAAAEKQDTLRRENDELKARTETLEAEVAGLKSGAAARESETAELSTLLESLLSAVDLQRESRLVAALDELGRRAEGLAADGPEAASAGAAETAPANPPALQAPRRAPEAEMPEAPCSPEMAAVIEGYDKRADGAKDDAADGGEAVAAADAAPEVIAELEDPAEAAFEIPAEAPTDEVPAIATQLGATLTDPADLPPPIVTGVEVVGEGEGRESGEATPAAAAGELSLEAIGELLKERGDARSAGGGGQAESVRKIIDRVNALADEMAEPSSQAPKPAAAADETEAADETADEAPDRTRTATGG